MIIEDKKYPLWKNKIQRDMMLGNMMLSKQLILVARSIPGSDDLENVFVTEIIVDMEKKINAYRMFRFFTNRMRFDWEKRKTAMNYEIERIIGKYNPLNVFISRRRDYNIYLGLE